MLCEGRVRLAVRALHDHSVQLAEEDFVRDEAHLAEDRPIAYGRLGHQRAARAGHGCGG